jgi:hypothetical protein
VIEISRSFIKQFRTVLRRSVWQHARRGGLQPAVEFNAGPDGVTIRCQHDGIAVSYQSPEPQHRESLRVPANALEDFEGRGQARVSLEAIDSNHLLARWDDAGVPHEKSYDVAEVAKPPVFPKLSARFTDNDHTILKALHDAMESTAHDSVRYAVHNVQLRSTGHIVGTDCRQLLVQRGFQFPWTGDVLVPRVPVFGQDFGQPTSVGVGRIDHHICFRIGPWKIWLPIDKDGRFPKYENVVPELSTATNHLHLSADDAAYLSKTLPHLPGHDDETPTATLDLNGQAMVRVRSAKQRPTEVLLAHSTTTGKAVRYAVSRSLLARALDLGFANLHIVDDQKPAVWTDDSRTYVFMTLGPSAVIASSTNSVQLRSDAEQSTNQPLPKSEKPVRQRTQQPEPIPHSNGQPVGNGNGRFQATTPPETTTEQEPKSAGLDALLQEAEALKEQLRDAYTRAHSLIAAAKQYRKQARVVNSTLASLRQLQEIAA